MRQQLKLGGKEKKNKTSLWLGQKAEAFSAAETTAESSESGSVRIGKRVQTCSVCLRVG